MINFIVNLLVYIWPLGLIAGIRPPLTPFPIYLIDLLSITTFFLVTIEVIKGKVRFPKEVLWFIPFATIAIISFILYSLIDIVHFQLVPLLYLLRLLSYPSVFIWIASKPKVFFQRQIRFSLFVFLIICFGQYIFLPDMRFLAQYGFDDHYYRLIGSFIDPNFTGAILSSLSALMIIRKKYLYAAVLVLALVLTFSRASYLSFVITVGYYFVFKSRSLAKIGLTTLALVVLVFLAPKPFGEGVNLLRTFSIFSRIETSVAGLELFSESPIIGWGYNSVSNLQGLSYSIDNSFIFILATTGVFGFYFFIRFLYKSISQLEDISIKYALISLIIHALFNNTLFYIWIYCFFWVGLAIGRKKL